VPGIVDSAAGRFEMQKTGLQAVVQVVSLSDETHHSRHCAVWSYISRFLKVDPIKPAHQV
jgi:hypothetical protein